MRIDDLRDRLAWLAMVSVILGSGAALQAQQPEPRGPEPHDPKPKEDVVFFFNEGPLDREARFEIQLSDHWIGISGDAADEVLRAQLKLPEGQGYVVTRVQPESPAAKADVEKNDVLLAIGDKGIADLPDLVAVIEANKDKELELTLVRGGERRTVKVTPAKRPEAAAPGDLPDERRAMDRWINRMPGRPGGRMRMLNFGPGMMWNDGGFFQGKQEFPKDLSVTVAKEGNAPAKIVVKQGDKEWTTSDDKLEALPEDVRPHVAGLLGRPQLAMRANTWELNAPAPGPGPRMHVELFPDARGPRMRVRGPELNDRLEDLNKQLEELRRSLEELREQPPAEAGAKVDES